METSAIKRFMIINKQWAKVEDIMSLTGFGKSKSYQIINDIQKQILEGGKKNIARGVVPMDRLVEYLGINKIAVYKAAMQEKNIFGLGGTN